MGQCLTADWDLMPILLGLSCLLIRVVDNTSMTPAQTDFCWKQGILHIVAVIIGPHSFQTHPALRDITPCYLRIVFVPQTHPHSTQSLRRALVLRFLHRSVHPIVPPKKHAYASSRANSLYIYTTLSWRPYSCWTLQRITWKT